MIAASDFAEWLRSRGVTDRIQTDGTIPPQPDRLVVVTVTGGAGTLRERTFDQPTVQVRTRGQQNDNADGETFASLVDDAIMGAVPPVSIAGRRVVSIDYQGGPPGFMLRDSARRTHYSCNYLLQVARSVF